MSFIRRSLTLAVTASVVMGGLSLGASAAEKSEKDHSKPLTTHKFGNVSRGLIVKTTTAEPSAAVLQAADAQPASPVEPALDESPKETAARLLRAHPVAAGVGAAVLIAVVKPRRLLRWAAFIAPVLWRMR